MEVQEGRVQLCADARGAVQEAGASRAAQELTAGRGEQVAADLVDIDRHLTDGLARVQQVDRSGLAGHLADLGGWVDQTALGGHMADRDQPDQFVDHGAQCVDVELAVLVVGHHVDHHAVAVGGLQERDGVARVLGTGCQDPVAGRPGQRVEGHVPGTGGVLHDRDVVPPGAHLTGQRVVRVLDPLGLRCSCLVPADLLLQAKMPDHRVDHRARR